MIIHFENICTIASRGHQVSAQGKVKKLVTNFRFPTFLVIYSANRMNSNQCNKIGRGIII